MVTTPPPMVLTMVKPRASVLVTTEPKVAAPPPTVLTWVTPAALVFVTTETEVGVPPLDETCVEAPEDAWDDAPEDAETPPAAALDDAVPAAALDAPADDGDKVLVTKTVVGGVDPVTVVVLPMTPAAEDVSVVAVAGPTGAGATLLDAVLVTTLTGEDTVVATTVLVEGGMLVEEGTC